MLIYSSYLCSFDLIYIYMTFGTGLNILKTKELKVTMSLA